VAAERTAAPLQAIADTLGNGWLGWVLGIAAITAMAGVLLNLVLGLSRVLLAMARRSDAPRFLARVDEQRSSPVVSVWACGIVIACISLAGDVRTTWSFSEFTVLVYYAITSLAALRQPPGDRLYPRIIPAAGLAGCLALAFRVDATVWITGLALLVLGLMAHFGRRRFGGSA
jgi:APA family basic amino acid/polyamine antiporter